MPTKTNYHGAKRSFFSLVFDSERDYNFSFSTSYVRQPGADNFWNPNAQMESADPKVTCLKDDEQLAWKVQLPLDPRIRGITLPKDFICVGSGVYSL